MVKRPVHESDVPWQTWYAGTHTEIRGRALSDVGRIAKIGFGLLELPPGSSTEPGHWHSREEEHVYALSGSATLHLGDESLALRAGSYVCFPAGQAVPHHLHNDGSVTFRYIIVGERLADDVVTYRKGRS